jgi:hypothetical protein
LYAQLTSYNFRLSIINLILLLGSYQVLLTAYEGMVIARLPFVPFNIFTGITHRGLSGEDMQDASAHLFFALGLMWSRGLVQLFMQHYKLRPVQPQMMNLLMEWQSESFGIKSE